MNDAHSKYASLNCNKDNKHRLHIGGALFKVNEQRDMEGRSRRCSITYML